MLRTTSVCFIVDPLPWPKSAGRMEGRNIAQSLQRRMKMAKKDKVVEVEATKDAAVDVAGQPTSGELAAAVDETLQPTTSVAAMAERIEELEEENEALSAYNDKLKEQVAYLDGKIAGMLEGMRAGKGVKADTHVGSIDDLGTIDQLGK